MLRSQKAKWGLKGLSGQNLKTQFSQKSGLEAGGVKVSAKYTECFFFFKIISELPDLFINLISNKNTYLVFKT